MKKLLLCMVMASGSFVSAQVLQNENFEEMTLGEVGVDITGMTEGQSGWFTFATNGTAPTTSTNAGNSNFEVVAEGFEGQGIKITGPNGNKGSRFLWKAGLPDLWDTRDAGNEVIEVEFDLYTGAPSSSTSRAGVRLYGSDGTTSRVLNGFVFSTGTKVLQGVCYIAPPAPNQEGAYLINLAAAPGLVLEADSWYRIGFSYDTITGEPRWKIAGDAQASGVDPAWFVDSSLFLIDEIDMVYDVPTPSPTVPTNTQSSEIIIDNLLVEATLEESLLGNAQFAAVDFAVYPNPATSVVNVSTPNDASIKQIVMTDLHGRTVKSVKLDNVSSAQVSISDLATGVYTLKVVSDKGTAIKKVIKG